MVMKVYHGGYMAVKTPAILKSKFPKDSGEIQNNKTGGGIYYG
jgi:threonyl-tRNA synthetase